MDFDATMPHFLLQQEICVNEDTPRTFILGQAFCVMTGLTIPLFGERTFEMTRELAEYLTGLKPPVTNVPHIREAIFLDYLLWASAISQVAGPMIFEFMRAQHADTAKLGTMPELGLLSDNEVMAEVDGFISRSRGNGIDFESPIQLMPLPMEIRAETQAWMDHTMHRGDCFKRLTTMRTEALVGI
jgi:hypothetical protein